MDHRFRTQKLTLGDIGKGGALGEVVSLDYGYVFKGQIILDDIRERKELEVLTIKIGQPFHDRFELFHIQSPVDHDNSAKHLRGSGGCIPRFFLRRIKSKGKGSTDKYELISKKLSCGHHLLPLCLAIHDDSPNYEFKFDCNLAYIKLNKADLSVINTALEEEGVTMQAGLERANYDINHKYCLQLTLLSISGKELGLITGQAYQPGDLY